MKDIKNDFNFSTYTKVNFQKNIIGFIIKYLPFFRGSWLFYSPIFSLIPRKYRLVEEVFFLNDKQLFNIYLDVSDPVELAMVKNGFSEPATAFTMWSLLRENDTFIDVGANFGFFSQTLSKKVGIKGQVISIEPNSVPYSFLIKSGINNILALNKAASRDSKSHFKIQKFFYRQTTSGRFLPNKKGIVESISLDEIYLDLKKPHVTVIKIDTEGAELLVLEGAQQLLKEQKPFIVAEVVPSYSKYFDYNIQKIEELMKKLGYNYIYYINEELNSISELEKLTEGQILFSQRKLEEKDFIN